MKKSEISLLNVVFCLLVIFIHICSEPVTKLNPGTIAHILVFAGWKLSGFVVQGFIMLAGVKLFLSKKAGSYPEYIKARGSKIVIPYILAVFVYYLYFLYRRYFGFSIKDLAGYILRGDLAAHFYFIIVVVQFYLFKAVWEFMVKKVPAYLGITVSAVITIWGIFSLGRVFGMYNDRVFTTYLIYWVIGCYVGKNYKSFMEVLEKCKAGVVWGFFAVAVAEVTFAYLKILPYYASEIMHILYCFGAIFASFAVATELAQKAMGYKLLKAVNSASFYIYLWHVLLIFITDGVMDRIGILSIDVRFFVRGAVVYVLSIFLCGMYCKIRRKIRG